MTAKILPPPAAGTYNPYISSALTELIFVP